MGSVSGDSKQDSRGRVPLLIEFTCLPPVTHLRHPESNGCRGGLEAYFSNKRQHSIELPSEDENGQTANLAFLVRFLCDNLMKDRRKEIFIMDGTV